MTQKASLTDPPCNLRECIDWVLRVTGKDQKGSPGNTDKLKSAVNAVLEGSGLDGLKELVDGLAGFIGYENGSGSVSGSGIVKKRYTSSYDSKKTQWDTLCSKSGSCCGSDSCSCSTSGQACPDQGCCDACPKRKCARIFLGMVPGLYYGLKIVYDRAKDSNWKGWNKIKRGSKLKNFLLAWGFDGMLNDNKDAKEISPLLDSLFQNVSDGPLEKLYDLVSKNYLQPSPSSQSKSPSTVREILLWLSGLRFTPGFSGLVSLCLENSRIFGNSFNGDAFCYYIHTSCFFSSAVISAIQDTSKPHVSSPSDASFLYPSDPRDLFNALLDHVYKLYFQLDFLRLQCQRNRDHGGWAYCVYGSKGPPTSTPSSSSSSPSDCQCDGHGKYLCTSQSQSSGSKSFKPCLESCPQPLRRFLCDSEDSLFPPPPGIPKMGFKDHLPENSSKKGSDISPALDSLCHDGFYPLTRLAQFLFCVSQRTPESLGDLFAFFYRFGSKMSSMTRGGFTDYFEVYVSGEPGKYAGRGLASSIASATLSNHNHNHSPTVFDLYSLHFCPLCLPCLLPFTYHPYDLFAPKFSGTYLSWICHLVPRLHSKLNELKEKLQACSYCKASSCQKIVECPCALPFLYKFGFTFASPGGLKDKSKNCSDFIYQLGKVIDGKPFKDLLSTIDSLIWSIRYPFTLFVLAFWSFVIYYYLYAHLYKLDTLHIRSHLHFPKTFRIPPATLLSGSSSKLKDLSYFGL